MFANQVATTSEEIVLAVNVAMVAISVVLAWRAARHGVYRLRSAHTASATIGLIYVFGYAWLLFGDVSVTTWSAIFRGVSLVAWPVVWWWPSILSTRIHRSLRDALERHIESEDGGA